MVKTGWVTIRRPRSTDLTKNDGDLVCLSCVTPGHFFSPTFSCYKDGITVCDERRCGGNGQMEDGFWLGTKCRYGRNVLILKLSGKTPRNTSGTRKDISPEWNVLR
ncbi:hypothetical protein E2C01_037781 [Portunus trituberculatus]|uniref:Uncharacterized protein n=1 Tax=Portunus trituberculatus TaxID=210409 RepID=A0A5B7FF07_PORTR|nr:hypothetical protein [Portunus trituberculatus]